MIRWATLRERLGTHGLVALLAMAAALTAAVVSARHLVSAAALPAPKSPENSAHDKQRAEKYAAAVQSHRQQFDGRSLFFIPSPPPLPPPPPPPAEDPKPPAPPPPPSKYEGPALIAMVHDSVWFDDGSRLKVGESSDKVRVVRIDAPWSALIEWKSVEFTVGLFERDKIVMPLPPPTPEPTEADPLSRLSANEPNPAGSEPPEEASKE